MSTNKVQTARTAAPIAGITTGMVVTEIQDFIGTEGLGWHLAETNGVEHGLAILVGGLFFLYGKYVDTNRDGIPDVLQDEEADVE